MEKLKKIKHGFFSRQLSIAKLGLKSGKDLLFQFKDQDMRTRLHQSLTKRAEEIGKELGLMKGSMMKAGQMLSLYGETFLPKEATEYLKKLQSESNYLEWDKMEKMLSKKQVEKLTISPTPLAAASIGQVHLAKQKEDQGPMNLACKIQYPSVKNAIESDLRALKWLLKSLKLLPQDIDTGPIFQEVREMLYQEMDYHQELQFNLDYQIRLKNYEYRDWFKIPQVYPDLSSDRVLVMDYMEAEKIESDLVDSLSQEIRNELAEKFLDFYFKELYDWGLVQTDAHPGNFLLDLKDLSAPKWVLLDFGATKKMDEELKKNYGNLIRFTYQADEKSYKNLLISLGYIPSDIDEMIWRELWEYTQIVMIPLCKSSFDFSNTTLPEEMSQKMTKIMSHLKIKNIPHQSFFLDRKIGGVFVILSKLKATVNCQSIIKKYLND